MPDGSNAACRYIFSSGICYNLRHCSNSSEQISRCCRAMFSRSPETLILRLPSLRTNSSSLSRTSQLTNTGLRSSIFGTCRKAVRYSSNDNLRCRLLTRQWDVGNVPSFPIGICRLPDWISDCSVTVNGVSIATLPVNDSSVLSTFSPSGRSCYISVPVIASHCSLLKLFFVAIIFEF